MEPYGSSKKLLAVILMTVITIIHRRWYKAGIRIQNVLGWIKVGLVVFMVFVALYVVVFRPNRPDSAQDLTPQAWNDLWDGTEWSFGTLATTLFKVFYLYTGLQNLTYVLNEVKNPVRTLISVSIVALITACLLYLLCNLAYFAVVPVEQIKSCGQLVVALFFEQKFGEKVGRRFLPLAVALSAAGNVIVVTFALVCPGAQLETGERY
jgi:amino acid transporter